MQNSFGSAGLCHVMLQSAVSQGPQERERFNEVGLAGAVGADEDVDGPDLKALQGADALEAFDCYVTQGWHGGSLRRSGDGAAGTDQILAQRLAAGKSSGDARTIGGSSYPNGAGRVGPCDSRVLEPAGQVTAAEPDAGEDRGRRRDANGNGGHHDGAGGAHWSEFEGLSGGGQGWRDVGGGLGRHLERNGHCPGREVPAWVLIGQQAGVQHPVRARQDEINHRGDPVGHRLRSSGDASPTLPPEPAVT